MNEEEYIVFKKAFWVWFDSLSPTSRYRYSLHRDDIAERQFFVTGWQQIKVDAAKNI